METKPRKLRPTYNELQQLDEVTIGVICLNKQHRITLRKKGAITLHHHSDYRKELEIAKLCKAIDSQVPKCVRVLQYWRESHMTGYSFNQPAVLGYGVLPPEVRNFRMLIERMHQYARRKVHVSTDSSREDQRYEWIDHMTFRPLAVLGYRLNSYALREFRIIQRNSSYNRKSTGPHAVSHWLFRMGASGLMNAIPKCFPLSISTDEAGHEWLSFVDNQLNEERVDISNGNRPKTVTGGESEARFAEAIRKFRLMESTSRRDHGNPYNGG